MAPVVLYSRTGCPFCADARACLEAEGVPHDEVEVGGADGESRRQELATLFGVPVSELTVPKITIGDVLVSSSEELRELRATSALKDLAWRAGATPVAPPPRQQPSGDRGAVCLLHTGPPESIWLEELRIRLASLGAAVCFLDVERLGAFDPVAPLPYGIVVNRVSDAVAPPLARFVASFLSLCMVQELPVINGTASCLAATSKIVQHGLFEAQGLRTPRSITVRCKADVEAALPLMGGGTILFKPNAGSFGKGIMKFDSHADLLEHAGRAFAFGNDGIALLQRFHAVQQTHRIFLLGDRVQCGVTVSIAEGQLTGQCMASAQKRRRVDGSSAVAVAAVEDRVQDGCVRVLRAAGADVASIEYMMEPESGEPLFYDFNLLSTYPDPKVVGEDCWLELAEYIVSKKKS